MSIFGLIYRAFPVMAAGSLGVIHFWLHRGGHCRAGGDAVPAVVWQRIAEAAMFPIAPISEALVMLGVLTFAYNLWTNAR